MLWKLQEWKVGERCVYVCVRVCVCVCVTTWYWERERQRDRQTDRASECLRKLLPPIFGWSLLFNLTHTHTHTRTHAHTHSSSQSPIPTNHTWSPHDYIVINKYYFGPFIFFTSDHIFLSLSLFKGLGVEIPINLEKIEFQNFNTKISPLKLFLN